MNTRRMIALFTVGLSVVSVEAARFSFFRTATAKTTLRHLMVPSYMRRGFSYAISRPYAPLSTGVMQPAACSWYKNLSMRSVTRNILMSGILLAGLQTKVHAASEEPVHDSSAPLPEYVKIVADPSDELMFACALDQSWVKIVREDKHIIRLEFIKKEKEHSVLLVRSGDHRSLNVARERAPWEGSQEIRFQRIKDQLLSIKSKNGSELKILKSSAGERYTSDGLSFGGYVKYLLNVQTALPSLFDTSTTAVATSQATSA